jgi:peptide deformylase
MREIRESEWFNAQSEGGNAPSIKTSPHSLFGRNT